MCRETVSAIHKLVFPFRDASHGYWVDQSFFGNRRSDLANLYVINRAKSFADFYVADFGSG